MRGPSSTFVAVRFGLFPCLRLIPHYRLHLNYLLYALFVTPFTFPFGCWFPLHVCLPGWTLAQVYGCSHVTRLLPTFGTLRIYLRTRLYLRLGYPRSLYLRALPHRALPCLFSSPLYLGYRFVIVPLIPATGCCTHIVTRLHYTTLLHSVTDTFAHARLHVWLPHTRFAFTRIYRPVYRFYPTPPDFPVTNQ